MQGLNPNDPAQMVSIEMSFKLMNNTMKDCFNDCITDFRQGSLDANEKKCLGNCTARVFSAT